MSEAFPELAIDELTADRKGAMKIGPFGSQLRKEEMVEHGVKVYGQENVIADDWTAGERRISLSKFQALSSCELEPGDLVVSMMGTAGKCAVFPADAERGIMDSHLLRIQPNLALVDWAYFAIALQAENVVGRQVTAMSHGSIMAGLSSKIVKRFKIPLPPLAEQPKIVEVLRALDTTIRETGAIIGKLKSVKQGLLHDLLTRGIDADGQLRPPRTEAPHLYQESALGWIPKEWRVCSLQRAAEVIDPNPSHRNPKYVDDGFPFISTVEFIEPDSIITDTPRRVSVNTVQDQERACNFRKGSIAFSRKGTIGATRLLPEGMRFALLDSLCVINARPGNDSQFLLQALRSHQFQHQSKNATMGVAMPQLSIGRVRDLNVMLPLAEEQHEIAKRLGVVSQNWTLEFENLKTLRALRAGLMNDLLTGHVRVTPLLDKAEREKEGD